MNLREMRRNTWYRLKENLQLLRQNATRIGGCIEVPLPRVCPEDKTMPSLLRKVRRYLNSRGPTKASRRYSAQWRPSLELLEGRLLPSVFPVTSTADSGPDTLRQAILDANANPGSDTISFAIPGPGVHLIQPASALPSIIDSVRIDGETQPGYAGAPLIQLNGSLAGSSANGLTISGNACTVRGLDIVRFAGSGIQVQGSNNVIQANYIGIDATGTKAEGNGHNGIGITRGSKNNLVGTNGDGVNDIGERNLISGNGGEGVGINGVGTNFNVVAGNFIGTDVTGSFSVGNVGGAGVVIEGGAQSNRIGVNGADKDPGGERNLISGNFEDGVNIQDQGTIKNVVAGNYIGTNATATAALANGDSWR